MYGDSPYTDGFIDGQEDILDQIFEIVELEGPTCDSDEALVSVMKFVKMKKKEIESL